MASDAHTPDAQRHPGALGALKDTISEFQSDNVMTWAAAVAFYAGLSLAPLLAVLAWIARSTLGDGAKDRVVAAFEEVLGEQAAEPIGDIIAQNQDAMSVSMSVFDWISVAILIFSATTVFAQLQAAMNSIWDVKASPSAGWFELIRKRLLSFGMLLAILFLLVISLSVSTAVQAMVGGGQEDQWYWPVLSAVISLLVFIPLFGLMYRYLPDVHIAWRDVWIGATLTAVLFVVGKFLLGLYLGRGNYESSYGAAVGSFIALLVWVYYSSVIFFIGAEATQVYARRHGSGITPNKHAVRADTRALSGTA